MANITKERALKIWAKEFGDVAYAKDVAGAWIVRDKYGVTTELGYGWEIDHRVPEAHGGSDNDINLRPLQWENNRSKSDHYPNWKSVVTSQGDHNIYKEEVWSFKK